MKTENKNNLKGNTIEINILNQKFLVKADENETNVGEVAEMVKRKVEQIRKKIPTATLQKAAMLAALDFANEIVKNKKKSQEHRSDLIQKTQSILDRVEKELEK